MRIALVPAMAVSLAAGSAAAQPAAEAPRERTGPSAAPQPVPDFPVPAPALAPPPAAAAPGPAAGGEVRFSEVRVALDRPGSALPQPGWHPRQDGDLSLSPPGPAGFDAAWVRRQFLDHGLVGRPVALDRVVALIQAINLAFATNGYINSGVLLAGGPPRDGEPLALRLVYGRLSGSDGPVTVAWAGGKARGLSRGFVRRRMRSAASVPLQAEAIERDFRLLAQDPAVRSVDAELRPGAAPGEASLLLAVRPAPRADLYLDLANSRSPSIGGLREAIGGSLRSAIAAGDLLSGEAGLTAGRPDFSLGYTAPFAYGDGALVLRGSYDDAAVVDRPLRPLDIRAREWSVEGGVSHDLSVRPLMPREGGGWTAARSLVAGLLVSHRKTLTRLLGQPFSFSPGSVNGRAEYSALRLTLDFTDRGVRHVTALSLTLSQGLEGTRSDVPGIARPDPAFRAVLAQFSEALRLDRDGLELRLRLTGQWADGILYSGERLAAGGAYTVRGYRETLALADTGAIGSVELARPFSLDGGRRSRGGADWGAFTASVFADGALLHDRAGPQPVPDRLASVGIGLAWTPSDAVSARITYAATLKAAPRSGSRDLQDEGIGFRLTIRPLLLFRRRD